jgi:hypothetical protein
MIWMKRVVWYDVYRALLGGLKVLLRRVVGFMAQWFVESCGVVEVIRVDSSAFFGGGVQGEGTRVFSATTTTAAAAAAAGIVRVGSGMERVRQQPQRSRRKVGPRGLAFDFRRVLASHC